MNSEQDYRVNLENFGGPLDLLLHLVRKEEVDIHDIPISKILDQYMKHLEVIHALDLDDAGDFLVMAATLMLIKSKMLLPTEDVDLEEEIDPRYELVQQLLEYKKLKDSALFLADRAEQVAKRVARPETARPDPTLVPDRSLDDVGMFELLTAFARILESIGSDSGKRERRIEVDDRPVRSYLTELGTTLRERRTLLFSELFDASTPKPRLIGFFLAILLLLKQEVISCAQDGEFGDIRVVYRGENEAQQLELDLNEDFA
jgi:segregation and condensation protein A